MITLGWSLVLLPVGLLLYAYIVYPAILWLLARGYAPRIATLAEFPIVSIVVPAYNEKTQIRGAIEASSLPWESLLWLLFALRLGYSIRA